MRYEYKLNGKIHRVIGPAVIKGDYQEWWINGKRQDGSPFIFNGKICQTSHYSGKITLNCGSNTVEIDYNDSSITVTTPSGKVAITI
jgi:hypothetical protein